MIVYAESSALLAWLLGDDGGDEAATVLMSSDHVIVSDLLFVEVDRTLIRAQSLDRLSDSRFASLRRQLIEASVHWQIQRLSAAVLDRSRQPFPREPVRSLDALHLASALRANALVPGVTMLTLDRRIRENAAALGLEVAPERRPAL